MVEPMTVVQWGGHDFQVGSMHWDWSPHSGIYIFAGITPENRWHALYIGQTDSFATRLPSHEQWEEAVKLGATHVHAAVVARQEERDSIESRLVQEYQPPLNVQLKRRNPVSEDDLLRSLEEALRRHSQK